MIYSKRPNQCLNTDKEVVDFIMSYEENIDLGIFDFDLHDKINKAAIERGLISEVCELSEELLTKILFHCGWRF